MSSILLKLLENGTLLLALVGLIGYFIKRIFDLKSKKVEIKFNIYHQAKLKYMIEFQSSYFSFVKSLDNYSEDFINKKQVSISEFDQNVSSLLKHFNSSHDSVRFFIKDLYKPAFDMTTEHLGNFYNMLMELVEKKNNLTEIELNKKTEELKSIKLLILKKGKSLIFEDINAKYRKEFESDNSTDIFKM